MTEQGLGWIDSQVISNNLTSDLASYLATFKALKGQAKLIVSNNFERLLNSVGVRGIEVNLEKGLFHRDK